MSSNKPHVLAVEDDSHTRILLRHVLGNHCDLLVVESRGSALEAVDSNSFDLLLLDIKLRSTDFGEPLGLGSEGADLLRVIRDRPRTSGVPAVAVTACTMPGDRESLLSAGFDRYVGKPFSSRGLQEVVGEMLHGTKKSRTVTS